MQKLDNFAKDSVVVVIPAFNEELRIEFELRSWLSLIEELGEESRVLVVDDGSTDLTSDICLGLCREFHKLIYIKQKNEGHGRALLRGYREACLMGVDYVFQADADGQVHADDFWKLWVQRSAGSLVLGHRIVRGDGRFRRGISKLMAFMIFIFFGENFLDANVPFRLFPATELSNWLQRLAGQSRFINIWLVVIAKECKVNIKWTPIVFRKRPAGKSSIRLRSFFPMGWSFGRELMGLRRQVGQRAS